MERGEVVLLHGLGLDRHMWDRVVERLGDRARALDVPGHGTEPTIDTEQTLDGLTADVATRLELATIDRPHLVGFSMGGMIAMRLAAGGARLRSLTLVSTSADPEPDDVRTRYEAMAEAFRTMPMSVEIADGLLAMQFSPGWADAHPEVRDRYRRMFMGNDRTGVWRASLAVVRRRAILDRLAGVRVPTLVIAGSADTATPPDCARRIAAAIPDAALVIVERAAHLVHEEAPDAFDAAFFPHLEDHH